MMEPEALSPVRLVEAALFTAGRPVSVDELMQATGLDAKAAKRAVKALEMEYEEKGDATALEVGQAGEKWAMQLKTTYVHHARMLADMEIPKKLLKTLALIAFHQPLLQSELVDMVGSKAYDHVKELTEFGLVRARQDGQSKRLTTAPNFPEYFGIPATDTMEIRTYLARKVGLTLRTPAGDARLDAFGPRRLAPARSLTAPDPSSIVEAWVRMRAESPEDSEALTAHEAPDAGTEADVDDEAPESAALTVGVQDATPVG